ncbi:MULTISPECIES: hypothetical protein [unclassified Nocardioides]|uniref:hypothetical protein n=1 Tax=unclassified Nocardioides TaxID=2615069 RepID=UPI0030150415
MKMKKSLVAAVVAIPGVVAALVAGVALTSPTTPPVEAAPSTPAPVHSTPAPGAQPITTPEPAPTAVVDAEVEKVFGTTEGLEDLALRWGGLTLGNGDVVAGRQEPFEAVAALPLSEALMKKVSRKAQCEAAGLVTVEMCPALEVMPDNLRTKTITGTGAVLNSVTTPDIEMSTHAGAPAIRLAFQATATWIYTEAGATAEQALTQDVLLWVLPSGDKAAPWYVVNYSVSPADTVEG